MAAIFKVGFNFVWEGDKPEKISNANHDDSRTVSARDAEHAIDKVRKALKNHKGDSIDDDGNLDGGKIDLAAIVIVSVSVEGTVDVL